MYAGELVEEAPGGGPLRRPRPPLIPAASWGRCRTWGGPGPVASSPPFRARSRSPASGPAGVPSTRGAPKPSSPVPSASPRPTRWVRTAGRAASCTRDGGRPPVSGGRRHERARERGGGRGAATAAGSPRPDQALPGAPGPAAAPLGDGQGPRRCGPESGSRERASRWWGESGCGKTTLGRCLVRLCGAHRRPDHLRRARTCWSLQGGELRQRRRWFQMVFQDPYGSLNPRMRVRTLLREPLAIPPGGAEGGDPPAASRSSSPRWGCRPRRRTAFSCN